MLNATLIRKIAAPWGFIGSPAVSFGERVLGQIGVNSNRIDGGGDWKEPAPWDRGCLIVAGNFHGGIYTRPLQELACKRIGFRVTRDSLAGKLLQRLRSYPSVQPPGPTTDFGPPPMARRHAGRKARPGHPWPVVNHAAKHASAEEPTQAVPAIHGVAPCWSESPAWPSMASRKSRCEACFGGGSYTGRARHPWRGAVPVGKP